MKTKAETCAYLRKTAAADIEDGDALKSREDAL